MADDKFITKAIVLGTLAVLLVLAILLIKDILIPIFLALLFAYILYPVFKKIKSKVKNQNLSTVILMVLMLLVVILSLVLIIPPLIGQTFDAYTKLQTLNLGDSIQRLSLSQFSPDTIRSMNIQINSLLSQLFNYLITSFSSFLISIPSIFISFLVFIFTFFFAVRDAEKIKEFTSNLTPLSKATEEKFLKEFRNITDGVIYGQILVGVVQGSLIGLGLFVLGLKATLPLTFIAIIASVLPVLGSWLVWIPITLWLFLSGSIVPAVLFLIYSIICAATTEGFLRSYFVARKSTLPMVLGFIGMVGGLYAFGILGLILGPLILAYIIIILEFYKQGKLKELFKS